jgi:hypothetical protein
MTGAEAGAILDRALRQQKKSNGGSGEASGSTGF